jgi:hypothetical protein
MTLTAKELEDKIRMVESDLAHMSSEAGLVALGTYLDYLKDELKIAEENEKTSQLEQKD